jgi:hypothetical protein
MWSSFNVQGKEFDDVSPLYLLFVVCSVSLVISALTRIRVVFEQLMDKIKKYKFYQSQFWVHVKEYALLSMKYVMLCLPATQLSVGRRIKVIVVCDRSGISNLTKPGFMTKWYVTFVTFYQVRATGRE